MRSRLILLAMLLMLGSIACSLMPQDYVEQANCGLDMKMVYVEGGEFQMGATSEQSGEAFNDESPVHNVQLDSLLYWRVRGNPSTMAEDYGYNHLSTAR